jgi:sugar phosphate isomerase/epimerase
LLGPYLAHCHLGAHQPTANRSEKTGTVQWQWTPCRLEDGLYHVPTMMQQMRKIGYGGFVSIEDFGPRSAEEKLRDAIVYLQTLV